MIEFVSNYYYELIIGMISIIVIGIIIMVVSSLRSQKKKASEEKEINGLNDTEITKIDNTLTKEELINEIFSLYKKVATARSKFNYDTLKELLIESLYLKEEQQLKQLKANKQKMVATNINLQNIKILAIQKKDNVELITAHLHVSQYDYIIDNKKNIIRGTDESEYQIEYRLTIEKNNDKYFKLSNIETTGKWIKNN